ncbi:hypothetical protein J437_LFUL011829 [Ladona fulva]|uniref:Major facilitator superfamily (MFS) profile domain-containing protein n=1 Tax=Ladona fulva TaxID=123851 RepID=A0A8K0KA40_LADFU|nr:hypothetical protein J437_LFUL011829 [Ladona fulva]
MPPSKPVQATVHEVQPLIKGAGAPVVLVDAASSRIGEVSSPKYRSVENESAEYERRTLLSPFVRQILAASGPVIATISSGMTSGFSAVLLPQLAAANSDFPVTVDESSWIASTAALPMAPGCLLGGLLMEKIGRRLTIILLCIPFALGWALQSAAPDVLALCLGRALSGFAVGLLGAPGMVYIGETAAPAHRGLLLAAVSLAVSIGVALSHLIGALLPWRTAAGIATLVPLVAAVMTFISPETPGWLASKGRMAEAAAVFRILRGTGPEAEKELEAMASRSPQKEEIRLEEVSVGGNFAKEEPVSRWRKWLSDWGALLKRPSFIKPFFIMNFFFFVQQWCGVNAVTFYTVDIFKATASGGVATVNEYMATGLVDVARVIASIVACILLRRCGRRPVAFVSGIISAASLLALAAFLTLGPSAAVPSINSGNSSLNLSEIIAENSTLAENVTDSWSLPAIAEEALDLAAHVWAWAPVVCLVIYVLASSIGLIPLPWVMTGEVFPVAGRGLGSGVTSCVGFLAFFSVVKTAPALFGNLGMGGSFCVYGVVVLIGTALLYFFLPETKGRTLHEIEEAFEGSHKHQEKQKEAGGDV